MSDNNNTLKINKISSIISIILVIIIPAIIVLISLKSGGFAPFGNKDIITASKTPEEIVYYYELYDKVHDSSNMSYSNSLDVSSDYISHYLYHLANPLTLFILLFSRERITTIINILYLINIVLCSLFFYYYLSHRKKSYKDNEQNTKSLDKANKKNFVLGGTGTPKSDIGLILYNIDYISVAISVTFPLSQYFVSEGLNLSFLSSIALLPLIIMGIDRIIDHNRPILYIFTLTLSLVFNIYISIISLIFIIIYYVIEATSENRSFLKSLRSFLPASLFSVLLSSFATFPIILGNDFQNNVILSFVRPKQLTNPWNALSQLMFKSDISNLTIYDSGVNLYMGILDLFLCLTYIFNSNIELKKRIKNLLLIIFLASGVIFSTPNYLLNGFRGFINNTYVFGYLITITILLMTHHNLSVVKGLKKSGIFISAALLMTLIVISMKLSENLNSINPLFYSMELLFIYFLIILVYRENSMNKLLFSIIVSVILIGELSITYNKNMTTIGQVAYTRPTVDAIDYKQYQTIRYIHNSIDANASVLPLPSSGKDAEPFITALSGYDYIISLSSSDRTFDMFEYVEEYKEDGMIVGVSIYKNTKPIKSYILNNDILSYHYNDTYPFESANILAREYLGNHDIYTLIDGETEGNPATYDNLINFTFKASEIGNAYVKTYNMVHLGTDSKIKPITLMQEIPVDRFDNYEYQYALLDSEALNHSLDCLAATTENAAIIPNKESVILSDTDGYLVIPTSYSSNLKITNNGKEVPVQRFINNTVIIPVNKGSNAILVQYSNKYLLIGLLISLLSIILVFSIAVISKKTKLNINKEIISRIYKKSYVYILTAVLLTLVFISVQMYTGSYPFGHRSTVMDDGLSQGYTVYVEHAKQIKNSNSWSWISQSIGLSRDTYIGAFISNIVHPFDLIKFKLLPESMYLFDFTLMYYLAFILNGLSFIFYMIRRHNNPYKFNDKKLIVLGSVYALSSYSVIMFNYECFRLMFYVPLIIWGLEKLIYDRKPYIYIIFLSCMMIYDAYPAFILCEFLCLIFITYQFEDIKHFGKSALRFIISSIGAAGIAAFKLLPYYSMTSGSGYSDNDSVLPSFTGFFTSYIKLLSDYRPLKYMRAISSDNSNAAIYIGMLLIVFIPLYALNKQINPSEKIKKLILLIFMYISFNSVLLNYIFHGFHYQSLVPNRYASIFIFICLNMIADVLTEFNSYSTKTLIILVSLCSALYLALHIVFGDIKERGVLFGISILVVTLSYLIYIYILNRKNDKAINKDISKDINTDINNNNIKKIDISTKLICYIMLIDVIINSAFLFSHNIGSSSNLLQEAENINNLTSNYSEITKPFEGSVYLNNSNYDISCMTDIESPVFFYSGASVSTLNMYTKYGIHHSLNTAYYGTGNPLADMMMHTRYHIQNSYQNTNTTWYPKVKAVNNLNVYENPYYLPLGFVVSNTYSSKLKSWDENNKSYNNLFEYNNEFFSTFSDSEAYNKIPLTEYNIVGNIQADTSSIDLESIINQINAQTYSVLNNIADKEIFYSMIISEKFNIYNNNNNSNNENNKENENDIAIETNNEQNNSYYKIGEVIERSNEQRSSFYVPVDIHIGTKNLENGSYYLCTSSYIMYIGEITNDEDINISIDIPVTTYNDIELIKGSLSIAKLNKDVLKQTQSILNQNCLSDISTNGRSISASLTSNEDGELYISLPYSENWKLLVDGKETKLFTYLGGMGADIIKGTHSIELKYYPAGISEGWIITGATIAILILLVIVGRIKSTASSKEADQNNKTDNAEKK